MHQDQSAQSPDAQADARQDISISMIAANVYTLLFSPLVALLALPFIFIWGWERIGYAEVQGLNSLWLLIAFLSGIVVHELLHGIGFVTFGRQPWRAVKFGFQWQTLTPYAHCRAPMLVAGYRWSVALPCLILGILPIVIATIIGSSALLIWGILFCWVAGGDAMIFWLVRNVGPNSLVIDHPDRAGCYVLSARDYQAGTQVEPVEPASNAPSR